MSELDFPTAYPRKSITNLYPRIWIMLLFWSGCIDALESHRFPYIYGLPILLLLYRPCVLQVFAVLTRLEAAQIILLMTALIQVGS